MSCVLRASGADFDVDTFLNGSSLDALTVFRRGELQFTGSKIVSQYSGMNISVSTREFSDLKGQIEDAVRFLSKHEEELRRLRDSQGLERMDLDFGIEERRAIFQSDSFPPDLLSLLGDSGIGLVVSRYPAHVQGEEGHLHPNPRDY